MTSENTKGHTPGPFSIVGDEICHDNGMRRVATISNYNGFENVPESEVDANAQLFAAAPETAAELDRLKEINAELVEKLQQLKTAWQVECNEPSGRFEDRTVFYDVFECVPYAEEQLS